MRKLEIPTSKRTVQVVHILIPVPRSIHSKVKLVANQYGMTMKDYIISALKRAADEDMEHWQAEMTPKRGKRSG